MIKFINLLCLCSGIPNSPTSFGSLGVEVKCSLNTHFFLSFQSVLKGQNRDGFQSEYLDKLLSY